MKELNPIIPMGAVSAPLSEEEVDIMMKSYADAGINQYLFYERGGTADNIEYMSEEWLSLCGCIFKYARKYGIKIWLYDEFDCPSGTCHLGVMKDKPEYRSQFIRVTGGKCEIGAYEKYSDILNPLVTDRFIAMTHEVYYSRFKEYFGDTIIGIFTDEPSYVYPSFRSGDDPEESKKYAYTEGLAEEYNTLTGGNFFADIIAGTPEFFVTYFRIMGKKLRENYFKKVREWCDAHGLVFTGHLMYEEELVMSLRSSYDSIAVLREMTMPGIDELTSASSPDTAEWITLGCLQAAARVTGKGAFCEVSALGPTDQPLEKKLQMLYLEAFFGIDHYLLGMGQADARENYLKKNWFTPMNYMQPWYAGMPAFIGEAKKAAAIAEKTIVPEIYVRYPIDTVAASFGAKNNINTTFLSLLRGLTENQYQWQLLDTDDKVPEGAKFVADYNTPLEVIKNEVPRDVLALNQDGNIAENVFLRRYTDGTVCVLDLTDDGGKSRKLILRDNGKDAPFTLYSRGIYVKGDETPCFASERPLSPEMTIALDSPNLLRCAFPGERVEYSFTAAEELDGICLYVRRYVFDGKVFLDGKEITADKTCAGLPYGIGKLYRESEPFSVQAGKHTVTISVHAESEPYLPAVFIAGMFAADKNAVLRKMPDAVGCGVLSDDVLVNFAGKITYSFELEVPEEDGVKLCFNSQSLFTRVYFNGKTAGEKFASPFMFSVPQEYRGGKVQVKIEQYTSVAPIFGRAVDVIPDVHPERVLSKYFPGKYESCGLDEMKLIY